MIKRYIILDEVKLELLQTGGDYSTTAIFNTRTEAIKGAEAQGISAWRIIDIPYHD